MSELIIPNLSLISGGEPRNASPIQNAFNEIQAWANGQIGTSNLESACVTSAILAADSVIEAKVADEAITPKKVGKGLIPIRWEATSNIVKSYGSPDTWVDLGVTLGSVTPDFDSTLLLLGQCKLLQGSGLVQWGVSDGTTLHAHAAMDAWSYHGLTQPLVGFFDLTASVTKTLKIQVRSDETGNITCYGSNQSFLMGVLVPREAA